MMFSVPQFIDIEDKIAGPLTWKQLLWMIGMGAALLVMFNTFDKALFFILAIPVILLFVALAFYRPNGIPLITFIFQMFFFLFRPKISVWERPVQRLPQSQPKESLPVAAGPSDKRITADRLKELAGILDNQGK
jgi:hypothetical protein